MLSILIQKYHLLIGVQFNFAIINSNQQEESVRNCTETQHIPPNAGRAGK